MEHAVAGSQFTRFFINPMNILCYQEISIQCWMGRTFYLYYEKETKKTRLINLYLFLIITPFVSITYHQDGICLSIFFKHKERFASTSDSASLPYCQFMNAIVFSYRQSTLQVYVVTGLIMYILPLEKYCYSLISLKSTRVIYIYAKRYKKQYICVCIFYL